MQDFDSDTEYESGSRRECSASTRHRLADAMQCEGVSPRAMALRLGIPLGELNRRMHPGFDPTLSEIYDWGAALGVPIGDLLDEPNESLSESVRRRAELIRVMRTVETLHQKFADSPQQLLTRQLKDDLIEMMPELAHVSTWPSVGQRRTMDEYGALAEHPIAAFDVFGDDYFD